MQARPQTGAKQGAERATTRVKVVELLTTKAVAADVERRKAEHSQLQSSATVLLSFPEFHQLVLTKNEDARCCRCGLCKVRHG